MKIFKFFILFVVVSTFFSCIPNRDLIYLQDYGNKPEGIVINEFDAKPYRVQVNDILSINIKALDQKLVEMFNASTQQSQQPNTQTIYFSGYNVNQHGNIRIPVLGEINVLGFTLEEIRATIEKKLTDEYFTAEARIFVTVKLAGFNYTVNGEIASPGSKVLFQEKVTILEAIANSGDITITGNRKEVQILRKQPHGFEMYSLDLTDAEIVNSPNFYIQPNDYIIVKPLKQKSWGTGTTGTQSIATIITALSLVTTTILLLRN
ncbi:polysaccharide biosynthesis/export family protein [Flavobacterium ponti]|jgi:polysaccharide export outer membrane protein|uniref:Polysaccharide biosynthesis/export family protein n=1 Tax=Flavobacterium ponti TaxID=665133 RepID=A0ABV9P5K9_9FLAO